MISPYQSSPHTVPIARPTPRFAGVSKRAACNAEEVSTQEISQPKMKGGTVSSLMNFFKTPTQTALEKSPVDLIKGLNVEA